MDKRGIVTSWRIRNKILLLLLLIFIPAFGVIVASGLSERKEKITKAENDALLLVQSLAAQQEQIATGTKQMLSTLAQMPELQRLDVEASSKLFHELHSFYPFYSVILASTPDGDVFSASMPFDAGVNLADRKHIRDAISSLDFSVGEHIVGRLSKVQSLNYTFPVLDANKKLLAIVIAGFKLNEYSRFLSKAKLPEGYAMTITDHKGVRLYRLPENAATAPGKPIPPDSFEIISGDADHGLFERTAEDGIERIYAFRQLRLKEEARPYLYMLVGMPKQAILQEANLEMLSNLSLLGVSALLAMGLAWAFGNSFLVRPINHLVTATQRFGKGELNTRTGLPHNPDELGHLAKSFDDMASLLEMRDIERRHAEEALTKAYAEMERRVEERTAALTTSNAALLVENAERRRVEEELQKLAAIVRFSSELVNLATPDGRMVFLNDAGARMLGIAPEAVEETHIMQVIPDHLQEKVRTVILPILTEQGTWEGDLQYRNLKTGKLIDVHATIFKITDPDTGAPRFLANVSLDITERKQAEDALRESEATLKSIFRAAPIGIGLAVDRILKQANECLCEMVGYSREELIGESVGVLYATQEDFEAAGREKYAQIRERGVGTVETRWKHKDGRVMDVLLSSAAIDLSDLSAGVTLAALDITERKRVAEALQESQLRFRELAELLPETIFEMDLSGRLTFVNRNAFDHFGFTPEDIDRGLNGFEILAAEDRLRAMANTKRILSGEKIGLNEYKVRRKDGSVFPVIIGSTVKLHDGEPAGFRGMIIDVTETKKLEAQLRQAHKMEAIGTLAGGIAHDFNNLLQTIQGFAELLLWDKSKDQEETIKLQQISYAARRGAELTLQLLTFSRRLEPQLQPVDLNGIINQVQVLLERTIPKMIKIELRLMGNLHYINADASQMEQVLMNLAINARDAIREEGELLIETTNVTLDEDFCRKHLEVTRGEYVLLSVSDTGHGMDKTTLEHIFDPFFTTKEVGKGTGLGLAMVYGIVKSHHGHIACHSRPAEGTTFNIYFPAIEHVDTSDEVVMEMDVLRGGNETLLLVDDEAAIRSLSEETLRMFGYTVLLAEDGESALEIYRKEKDRIDLVILDLIMPGMGGKQCLEKLIEINPHIKVVIATGYSEDQSFVENAGKEARRILAKPYDVAQIVTAIRDVLDEK
jgi:PAS domain S-box-containing protein